ncbi:MAG: hypothetical protein Q9218_005534, partial [Villophora microphyllina]
MTEGIVLLEAPASPSAVDSFVFREDILKMISTLVPEALSISRTASYILFGYVLYLQELYGPIIRHTPNSVLFQTPDAFRAIYDSKANVQKAKQYQAWARHVNAQTTFTAIDKTMHARKRRVLNAAFSDKALRSAEETSLRHIDRWCDLLAGDVGSGDERLEGTLWTEPRNMTDWSDYLILDILTELSFGESFETKEPKENPKKTIPHSIVWYLSFLYPITWSPFLGIWLWLKPRGLDRLIESNLPPGNKQMMAIVDSCLSHRYAEEQIRRLNKHPVDKTGSRDLLQYLLQADDPEGGPGFSPLELRAETELLLSAGFDTTSAVIAAIFFYLSRNPAAYTKLAQEIRQSFTSTEEIVNGSKLSDCVYLRAVINETMRMSPPGVAEGIREVLPGGITIEGHTIPEGYNVGSALYAIHHHQDIFGDPFVFRPERWIASETVTE